MIEFLNPSVEFLTQPITPEDKLIHIERAGRTCYKSESEYTPETALRFFKETVKRKHYSVLEHACKTILLKNYEFNMLQSILFSLDSDLLDFVKKVRSGDYTYLTFNYRTIAELIELIELLPIESYINKKILINLSASIAFNTPFLDILKRMYEVDVVNNYDVDINESDDISTKQKEKLTRVSFKVVTSRSISHEFVRHRSHTFSQESTRYVGYAGKPIQMIVPKPGGELEEQYNRYVNSGEWDINRWISDTSMYERTGDVPEHLIYCHACVMSATDYTLMIEAGAQKGRARDVLPNGLKTEFVVTASLYYWKHCLELREDKPAHSDIQYLANRIHQYLEVAYPNSDWNVIHHSKQKHLSV